MIAPVLIAIGERSGAVGVQVAHSGSAAGLLFDARSQSVRSRVEHALAGLERAGISDVTAFQLGMTRRVA